MLSHEERVQRLHCFKIELKQRYHNPSPKKKLKLNAKSNVSYIKSEVIVGRIP